MNENGKTVPEEIRGWNWGAFIYNIFWGIGNKTYLPLLCLIPVFNLVWIFVVALKATNGLGKKVITKMLILLKPFKQLGIVPDLSNSLSQ